MAKITEPGYFVVGYDDELGKHVVLQGYLTATGCAFALAQIVDGIYADEFRRTWNGFNRAADTRYEMGLASRAEVLNGGDL